jgi:flagellar hook-length control protein FliK
VRFARHGQSSSPAASPFGQGNEHIVDPAREAQNGAAQLAEAAPAALNAVGADGRRPPQGGKTLPQSFRTSILSRALAANESRAAAAHGSTDALPEQNPDTALASAFASAFAADVVPAEARAQQNAASALPSLNHGIQGLRTELPLPAAQHAGAETSSADGTLQLQSPYIAGSDAWFEDLGTRVEWLKDMNIETAELQLHPAELGQLEIHISTGDDATTVSFVTSNADARELIESSMPRLRELLASQGLQLGQSEVSQNSEGQRREQNLNGQAREGTDATPAEDATPKRRTVYIADPNRIDHYV